MKTKGSLVLTHVLCSLVFLLFPFFASPDFPHVSITLSNPNGFREVMSHVLLLGFFYLSYGLLLPRLYFRQRYLAFYLSVASAALLIFFLLFGILDHIPHALSTPEHLAEHRGGPPFPQGGHMRPPRFNILRTILFDYSLYLFLIVLFTSMLLKTNERWRKLQQEKLETELSYLKAQINPHFLFNTLNSIYSLAIQKSDYTATAVVKLSGMMRYLIGEAGKHFVSLEREISYISDYIELQKFRLGGTVKIHYELRGPFGGREIAPLVLITFVENAFKYGVNPEEYSEIHITITFEKDRLRLMVENNKVTTHQGFSEASGLGIDNARHRLEMLYPGQHTLSIEQNSEKFVVHLELILA